MPRLWKVLLIGIPMIGTAAYLVPGSPVPGTLDPLLASWMGSKPADTAAQGKAAASKGPAGKGAPTAPVTVAEAALTDMPVVLSAPGTVEPLATVAIRPRVEGQIIHVGFQEGDFVEAGHVLFRLDDRLVKAQIQQAEANIARDKANLKDAEAILERRETLLRKNYVSEAATETARQTAEALKASIKSGEAQLEAQRTQLDYLVIRAPISGRTGSQSAKLGATVRTNEAAALVTINQTRPIAVAFAVPQSELGALRRALSQKATAEIAIAASRGAGQSGTITFVDNQVDKLTGTVTAKVTAENKDEVLWPGQAVEVALRVEVRPSMLSVPASAVLPSQDGMMVWVIGSDNKATTRPVTLERVVGQTAFLSGGLKPGERVVTDGQLRLAPGSSVTVQQPKSKDPPAGNGERRATGRS